MPLMNTSGNPIIELRGHWVQNVFQTVDSFEQSFLLEMDSRTDLLSTIQAKLIVILMALARFFLMLYQYIAMVRPLFGFQDEVTLRFYKEHIDLYIDGTRFFVPTPQEQQKIAWHNTSVRGKRVSVLFFFKRCHLFITHGESGSRIIDLGPMPETEFRQLVERLKAFASSSVIRQQVATAKPYRFRAEGLKMLALAMFGILMIIGVGLVVTLYGPQLLKWFQSEFHSETEKSAEAVKSAADDGQKQKVEEDFAFMTDLEAKYRQTLLTDPDNLEAKEGLRLLAEQYVGLARKAGEDQAWNKADGFLIRAEQIEPTLPSIEPAREKIRLARERAMGTRMVAAGASSPSKPVKPTPPKEKNYGWLVDNKDGTVTDTRSGLMGLRISCFDKDPWEQSMATVAHLADGQCDLADGSAEGDWRLPTKEELPNLVEWEKSGRFAVEPGRRYWSGTTHFEDDAFAWFADPKKGFVDRERKNSSHHVWPVRNKAHNTSR